MNKAEFNDWYTEFCAAFPGTDAWIATKGGGTRTLANWLAVLVDCDADCAKMATMMILSGKEPTIHAYERSETPVRIRDICKRLEAKHSIPAEPSPLEQRRTDKAAQWDTKVILAKLLDCAARGGDVEALAKKLMPIADDSAPRYKCLICKDRGLVRVWRAESMELAAKGELTSVHGCSSAAIRCECEAGNRYERMSLGLWGLGADPKDARATPIIYNERQWCICEGYAESDREKLAAFMQENCRPANYEPAFEAWNNRD